MKYKLLRGFTDVFPDEYLKRQDIFDKFRTIFELFGYSQIDTPIVESTNLFVRSIGAFSEIVKKQMLTFKDKSNRSLSLRPEATASVARAYIENDFLRTKKFVKWFYIGPMFRNERPQAGRRRQFYQLGIEAIGSKSPYLDAEVISLLCALLEVINIPDYKLKLNTLGCIKDKSRITYEYEKLLKDKIGNFCQDCQERFKFNILRIFDCKNSECKNQLKSIPPIIKYLCTDCIEHYEKVKKALSDLEIKFEQDSNIVRGLDYYDKTVFEVIHPELGAKSAIGAGGRYDNLIKDMGGPEIGACGFALGLERIISIVSDNLNPKFSLDIYIVTLGEESYNSGFKLLNNLRRQEISADIDYEGRSLKSQMRQANKVGAKFVVIIGEDELKNNKITLRDMSKNKQSQLEMDNFVEKMKEILKII